MFKLKINKAKLETGGNRGTQKRSCGHRPSPCLNINSNKCIDLNAPENS